MKNIQACPHSTDSTERPGVDARVDGDEASRRRGEREHAAAGVFVDNLAEGGTTVDASAQFIKTGSALTNPVHRRIVVKPSPIGVKLSHATRRSRRRRKK
jgi:hypothetical protein